MKIVTKAEAKKQGLTTYYTGKPCPRGHNAPRYVNGKCIECNRERNKLRPKKTGKTGKTRKKLPKAIISAPVAVGADLVAVTPITDDWQSLPAATRADLGKRAQRIRAALERSLAEVGLELTEAKKMLNHGQFTAWVERETGLTPRTAQLIMSAYRLISKNENFSLLPRSALFLLGAHDLPAATINLLKERITEGDVPSYTEVRRITQQTSKPNSVNLAVKMGHEPDKAPVVDLDVHRRLAKVKADPLLDPESQESQELKKSVREFSDQIRVADIAIMLSAILDSGQIYRLVTMIRNAAPEATLAALADALERTDPIAETT